MSDFTIENAVARLRLKATVLGKEIDLIKIIKKSRIKHNPRSEVDI
jgi:hypothetical protein